MPIFRIGLFFSIIASIGFCSTSSIACDERVGKPIADRVTHEIGVMIQFTKAACFIAREGKRCSLVCVSDLYVQGLNRNIVLMFITASGGKKMREAGLSKFDSIAFADRELLQNGRALKVSAEGAAAFSVGSSEPPQDAANRAGRLYSEVAFKR